MKEWLSKLDPKWVASNVIGWGFLAAVMYSVFVYMILPTQEHNFKAMDRMTEIQTEIVKVQNNQTPILERIDRNTSK